MNVFPLKDRIRQRRKDLGLTQEELSEGICDVVTISRLENGKQVPSYRKISAILQRLGLPECRYYALLSDDEIREERIRREVVSSAAAFARAMGAKKAAARARTMEYLEQLEALCAKDEPIVQQFVLGIRTFLGTEQGPYPPAEQLERLFRGLRLTVPRFAVDRMDRLYYTEAEVWFIVQIAGVYRQKRQLHRAIRIYQTVLRRLEEAELPSWQMCATASRYAQTLCLANCYQEAWAVADETGRDCLRCGYIRAIPELLAVKASCAHAMGDLGLSRRLYKQSYHVYQGIGDAFCAECLREEAEAQLNGPLD